MNDVRRRGEVGKCPACGSAVDPGAYHCPKCRNYFCFKCRVRVVKADPQFQCVNPACEYHGKLLCGNCDPEVRKEEPPTVYTEREPGWAPLLLFAGLVGWIVSLFYTTASTGLGYALLAVLATGVLLHLLGVNVLGKDLKIVRERFSTYHTCSGCGLVAKPVQ